MLNDYQQTLVWKGSPKHNFSIAFLKETFDKCNLQELLPILKICHNKFDPLFDPSKNIMLGIEGIKFCRIITSSLHPVHLTKPQLNQQVDGGSLFFQWISARECS